MRRLVLAALVLVFITVIVLPYMLIKVLATPSPSVRVSGEPKVNVRISETGENLSLSIEDYLVGVVAAEMPASFEIEALKAQAIAARTYTLKKIENNRTRPDPKHPDADVCTDAVHCQGWLSIQQMRERWGLWRYLSYRNKIRGAVMATRGMVMTYQNRLIDPVYHSTSGGETENSEDVWKYSIPYLRSVECRWDKDSPRYTETVTFSWAELDRKLDTGLQVLPVSTLAGNTSLLKVTGYSSTGRVKSLRINKKDFAGVDLRRLLGLRSTNFKWQTSSKGVTFTTIGNGHGVGLCQYGANGQAKEDRSYSQILTYYYTGIKLDKYF
ncbi:MAG: stage II sporulation protein D [Bacillota bacterium]